MDNEMVKILHTKDQDLLPCPHCGGRVSMIESSWDWGPYDLRHVKYHCAGCGAIFEYAWRSDPWQHVPDAVEWWNTRTPAPPWTCKGYTTEQLVAVADLLKEHQITPAKLEDMCINLQACIKIAERKFIIDLQKQLQDVLDQIPDRRPNA